MKFTVIAPTNGDWNRLRPFADTFLVNTAQKNEVRFILLDNCNTLKHDLRPFMNEMRAGWEHRGGNPDDLILLKAPRRLGLAEAWDFGFQHAETDWVVIVNDDVQFKHCWDDQFRKLVRRKPLFDAFLLCHPYNWSGFAVCHRFVAQFPLNRCQFPEGYYEDDDIYLRVASRNRHSRKRQVYTQDIYCLPYNEKDKKGNPRSLFEHHPIHSTADSEFHLRWDDKLNYAQFAQYWQQAQPHEAGAIESKDERHWWKPTSLQKKRR